MDAEASKTHTRVADVDVEKGTPLEFSPQSQPYPRTHATWSSRLAQWNTKVEGMAGFEARGLERVPLEHRLPLSTMGLVQMGFLWAQREPHHQQHGCRYDLQYRLRTRIRR